MSAERNGKVERSKPESLRLKMITPSLTAGDFEASLAWYSEVLGFTVLEEWEHDGKILGAELAAGAARLMLGRDDWAKGRDRKKGEGMRLYFSVSQDLDEIAEGIKARGGTLEAEPQDMPWGGRAFSVADPDGFNITFSTGS